LKKVNIMIKKCIGCGVLLQNESESKKGYVENIENNLCQRCFKIKHYNKKIEENNINYEEVLKKINESNDLIVLLVSLLSPSIINNINNLFPNKKILLVLTKKDLLPKSTKEEKIINNLINKNLNLLETVVVSSFKNYNINLLYEKINKYKKTNNVYIVGYTNSGKSTLINKFIKNYTKNQDEITCSNYPNTTLDFINIKINDDLNLIDTPGIVDDNNIINKLSEKDLKKILPKKEIKPKTRKVSKNISFIIEDMFRIDYEGIFNSLTFYMANNLKLDIVSLNNPKLKEHKKECFILTNNEDIVIDDILFIKIVNECKITIYSKIDTKIYKRKKLI